MSRRCVLCLATLLAWPGLAPAQPPGTFRWQLQPCNIVTVAVTRNGGVHRLEGTDDQCGNGTDAAGVALDARQEVRR